MRIDRVMSRELVTVGSEMSLFDARALLQEKQLKRLLVVDATGRLEGILDARDITERTLLDMASDGKTTSRQDAEMTALLKQLSVGDAMTVDPLTVTSDMTIDVVAMVMHKAQRNAVPVLEDGRPVGMVNERVIFAVLCSTLSALRRESPQLLERILSTVHS